MQSLFSLFLMAAHQTTKRDLSYSNRYSGSIETIGESRVSPGGFRCVMTSLFCKSPLNCSSFKELNLLRS